MHRATGSDFERVPRQKTPLPSVTNPLPAREVDNHNRRPHVGSMKTRRSVLVFLGSVVGPECGGPSIPQKSHADLHAAAAACGTDTGENGRAAKSRMIGASQGSSGLSVSAKWPFACRTGRRKLVNVMTHSHIASLSLLGALALPFLLNCSGSPSTSPVENDGTSEVDKASAIAADSTKAGEEFPRARPPREWPAPTDASASTAPESSTTDPAPVGVTDDPVPACPATAPTERAPCSGQGGEDGCSFASETCHCINDHWRCEIAGS
jgi:hypothetical protein